MNPLKVKVEIPFGPAAAYDIKISCELLTQAGKWSRKCLGKAASRVLVVSNPTVSKLYGKQVVSGLLDSGFEVAQFLMKDGERYKDMRSAEACLRAMAENGIARTDGVIALGGGVVGDLAGFAAALHLRGIRFLQIPTTLLAMVDSSVGGKTGVNSASGKNLIGAFHQPAGVLIDVDVLTTLPRRELTAGFCEIIKHGAIGGRHLLETADKFLSDHPLKELRPNSYDDKFRCDIANLIAENVAFKAKIVAGDEREAAKNIGPNSRKILNFAHTLAHALEKVTNYRVLRHGEAVGYGILFAAELSKSLALLDEKSVKLLNDVVHRAGPLPALPNIDIQEVLEAFRFDKKHLSGSLQFVLLKGFGQPVIETSSDIPLTAIKQALKTVLR